MGGLGGNGGFCRLARLLALAAGCLALGHCTNSNLASKVDPKYGVHTSARVVEPGEPVPKGGGTYRVGKPYTVAGRTYVPEENINYSAEGLASWYGDDFHGRYTANGEIYDMNSISAAHPTLPLPSYVRVTNQVSHRSIVVRVNDRGPYVGDRVIDLSAKTAQLLGFHGHGLAKVKVEYIGRAPLEGSDDRKLMATLRDGVSGPAAQVASNKPSAPAYFDARPMARLPSRGPSPPERPYRLGEGPREVPAVTAQSAPLRPKNPTTELAASARPRAAEAAAPLTPGSEPRGSTVSAYAPARYDSHAGYMSGRGLY